MGISYPSGTNPAFHFAKDSQKKQANTKNSVSFSNRGMNFEEAINESNTYYLAHGTAVVHKKPTPLQIVKVDYPKRSAAVIKEAYFTQASTTDYNGVYRGFYLDFEAKETKNKTSFPLKNFHQHQVTHFVECLKQNGICFVLLYFSSLNRCFFLSAAHFITYWDELGGKKSVSLAQIEKDGIEIKEGVLPRIPYIDAVTAYLKEDVKDE